MYVASLHVYPVKGCKGIDLQQATFGPRSLKYDRHWIIVDAEGEKITQREEPRLALIRTRIEDDTLTLSADGQGRAHVDINTVPESKRALEVWGDQCTGLVERPEASQWLSDFLRQPVTLLRFDETTRREVDEVWGGGASQAHIAFNDCLPVLIGNTASLDQLNDWRAEDGLEPTPMNRFRPNIVVTGALAWDEEDWAALCGPNGIQLDVTRPCSRCRVTNVVQETGLPEEHGNLHVLGRRRHGKNYLGQAGAFFGVQAHVTGCDGLSLRVGDALEPGAARPGLPGLPRITR